jgi:hypothetical protein
MPKQRLAIHPAPFKPSHLSIPPSPFSPLSPLTPAARPGIRAPCTLLKTETKTQSVPAPPLQWIWTCHACHSAYPLGATRRCLDDGHHFCAGTTIVKKWRHDGPKRRVKRHKACASAFDYMGWKGWGRWKRVSLTFKPNAPRTKTPSGGKHCGESSAPKDCWTQCDYPSQCRWGKRVGIHTPSPTPTRTTFSFDNSSINTSVLNTLIDLPSLDDCFVTSPPPDTDLQGNVGALGRALKASAKRGMSLGSVSPTSPLKMEFSQTSAVFDVEMVDSEGSEETLAGPTTSTTVDDSCIDPALLVLSNVDTPYSPHCARASVAGATSNERSRTVDKLKTLLSLSSPRPSRRHIELLPVSNAQRKLRRRHAMSGLTLPEPLVGQQEPAIERFSPLEGGRRWNESALNVM